MSSEILEVPLEQIHVLNPRKRDAKKFANVLESIRTLGLKKPIKVSRRRSRSDNDAGYDLVYGQGRLEAFKALGHTTIPALVVNISKEDRMLLSLVENMARRFPRHSDLMDEILRLHEKQISNREIGRRLGLVDTVVAGYLALRQHGEERLLEAALRGSVPVTVAMEIAKIQDIDEQRAFLEAYQSGAFGTVSIRSVKRLLEQRRLLGKDLPPRAKKSRASAEGMIHAFRKMTDQQRRTIAKARTCEQKLLFVVTALKRLLSDEDFRNLLRAEKIDSLPEFIAQKVNATHAEAA